MENKRYKVGITLGDYNGIGPEVIIKALEDERMFHFCTVVIYGQKNIISYYAKNLKIQNFNVQETDDLNRLNPKIPNIINCWTEHTQVQTGSATEEAGEKALLCLDRGIQDLLSGAIDVLVTGPVNKNTISERLPDFTGQTGYLAAKAGVSDPMMILGTDDLKIGLVTTHIPLRDVAAQLDITLIAAKIEKLNQSLKEDFLLNGPLIAVLGLNPHAGDNGLLGKEEKDIIAPAVNKAKDKGILVLGPYATDGFFGARHYQKFNAVLAMYHDQGLAPFKTLSFDSGVNYTAGLPVVRTSPDHGTGYDIAGKNLASPNSLRSAIFMGLDIVKNREVYKEMTANPVERVKLEHE